MLKIGVEHVQPGRFTRRDSYKRCGTTRPQIAQGGRIRCRVEMSARSAQRALVRRQREHGETLSGEVKRDAQRLGGATEGRCECVSHSLALPWLARSFCSHCIVSAFIFRRRELRVQRGFGRFR